MKAYSGKSVFNGIAMGVTKVYKKGGQPVKRRKTGNADKEIIRYQKAKETAVRELCKLYQKALKEVGETNAAIFEIHQMMLEDDDYNDSVENIIRTQMVNAEYAVAVTEDNFMQMFSSMEDEYMRGRAADVRDISERLVTILSGKKKDNTEFSEPSIIVAHDLAPSETVLFDKEKVLAFVTVSGSMNSHTAILAKTMGIPALVNSDVILDDSIDGKFGIVDGINGVFYIEPDKAILEEMKKRQAQEEEQKRLLSLLKGRENVTLDGKKVMLYANIGNIRDLAAVVQNDADGIGLFRSEFIYLERDTFPTEEEQFQIYKTVVQTMAGKSVIIRTLDIGADKQCNYFQMDKEENPALGCRAIRICLTRPEIFKTQLRALFRAGVFGKLAVMYPMITSLKEIHDIKRIVSEVREELQREGIEYKEPQQGIMIETPAAVMISSQLAKEVDFFSIGTNDLTQYTLAVDRQNTKLEEFYDVYHPAVLEMIAMVIKNAHKAGIWVGICGELGADTKLTKEFLAMGADELSVSPSKILPLKKEILETDVEAYRRGKQGKNVDRTAL